MAGTSTVSQAVNYLVKIIDSEGAEAPYLFAKDKACADALRFVNQVFKAEEQGKGLTSIKKIQKRLNDTQRLPQLPTLEILKNQLGEDEQAFNDIMLDPICFNHTSEYADLASHIDNEIEQACMHFYTYNPQIQFSAKSETKRLKKELQSKTKRSKKDKRTATKMQPKLAAFLV